MIAEADELRFGRLELSVIRNVRKSEGEMCTGLQNGVRPSAGGREALGSDLERNSGGRAERGHL